MTVVAVLESTLPPFCLSYKIQHNEATMAVFFFFLTVLAVPAVMAVSVMMATPLNSTPFFRNPDKQHFTRNPPLPEPPPNKEPLTPQILDVWGLFPFKIQENGLT